jgi:DNA-binding MarR family transcriptional regulator
MNTLPQLHGGDRPHANQSLPARLMAVTHFVQKQAMDRLLQNRRYGKLSLAYTHYIVLLAERDRSPGELAERLGISKQACSKVVQELEALGLIRRRVNPQDSRSSMLSLSTKGLDLLRDGVAAVDAVQSPLLAAIGEARMTQLLDVFDRLCAAMRMELPAQVSAVETAIAGKTGTQPTRLAVLLPWLSILVRRRLMNSVSQQRFSDLRPGVGQLLGMISEEGKRLQYIASLLGVSKQAVATTAAELEQLGYATRKEDPEDRRQIIVGLSARGRALLREVVASVDEVDAMIRSALGDADYRFLDDTMAAFYAQITVQYDSAGALRARIQQLSKQLVDELGVTGARALAQQLISMTRGKR